MQRGSGMVGARLVAEAQVCASALSTDRRAGYRPRSSDVIVLIPQHHFLWYSFQSTTYPLSQYG